MKHDPSERFLTLSHVIDEVPDEAGGELLRVVASAYFATVRHMRGTATETEALFAIDRAREALLPEVSARGAKSARRRCA